tara:strand:+ start:67 stop:612 length:546 start_codon:yes stop_codon:yes gene_type:complete
MVSIKSFSLFFILVISIFLQGCTTVISAAGDKRDLSTQYDDEKIGFTCISDFSDIEGKFRADCNAYDGKVLVTGQAENKTIIDQVVSAVRSIDGVKAIYNRMTIGPNNSSSGIADDIEISGKVVAALLEADGVSKLHVRIFTESRVTYLMGRVSQSEANIAIQVTKSVEGVEKVDSLLTIQ